MVVDEGEPTGSTALEATIATRSGETVRVEDYSTHFKQWYTGSHSSFWMDRTYGVGEMSFDTSPELMYTRSHSIERRSADVGGESYNE
ncbi:hypothetical protein Tco_0892631 [Tanacetum coccineum]|uniref:Uncharacterized protein n=1 Tax=Tanacetum coccineum TaxID=301880 RepID=A0ABQ5CBU5_9ASTR